MKLFDVYRQIVIGSISEGRSLQVLSHATEQPKDREHNPTWMPIWHAGGDSRHTGPRRTFLYNASKGNEPQLSVFANHRLLGLVGLVAGTVAQTRFNLILSDHMVPVDSINLGTSLAELRMISRLIVRDCWQPEDNWVAEAICRTDAQPTAHFEDFCAFVAERLDKSSPLPSQLSLHGKWCDICMTRHTVSPNRDLDEVIEILHCEDCFDFDMCKNCHRLGHTCPGRHELSPRPVPSIICHLNEHTRDTFDENRSKGNSKRFDTGAKQSFDGKCFVRLDNGLIGIAPEDVGAGDVVVVFLGSRVPFVLRKHQGHHVLLGECYIHDIMDGEVVDDWQEGKLKAETFILE